MGANVCRWTSSDGIHRVYLIARHDGRFTCFSQRFSDAEFERCWVQESAGGSLFDSEEVALAEIRASFPWSKEVKREDLPPSQSGFDL
jgi:hypothetical protein